MIVIAGSVRVRPERRAEAIRVAVEMARATRQEPGCRHYRFSSDLEDPDLFLLFEEWESADALTRHFATEHMRVFQQNLPDILGGPADIHRYEVGASSKMM
jgi:quinol monooxygenase YgiN